MWTKFSQQLIEIVDLSKKLDKSTDALRYIKEQMNKNIYPNLRRHSVEALSYSSKRDLDNENKSKKINVIFESINSLMLTMEFSVFPLIMSSYRAKLNLVDDSDLDIGLLVDELDDVKTNILHECLVKDGFKYTKTVGVEYTNNYYRSYQKIDCGIEIELKIRDKERSKLIVDLHYFLDNKLSDEERSLLTYAKYMLKKSGNENGYRCMKKLIYEYGFSCFNIEEGFLFIM